MAAANSASFNNALAKLFENGIKTIASELLDGDIVIHKMPGPESSGGNLYNACSVRRALASKTDPGIFFAVGQHDFPTNYPEFKVPKDTLVVQLYCHVEPKPVRVEAKKDLEAETV